MKTFLKRHSLVIGLVLMFLYTWTIDLSNSGVLPFKVPFVICLTLGWGFIFASLLMTWLTLGKEETAKLFKRFLIWHVEWRWFLAAFLIPMIFVFAILLNWVITQTPIDFSAVMARRIFGEEATLPAFILPFFLVDFLTNGEEMGWRGYVLPRLQAKHSALVSSLILGLLWAFWHLPKYLAPENSSSFLLGSAKILAEAVLYTWLYNNSKGSLLMTSLMHSLGNTAGVFLPLAGTISGANTGTLVIVVALEVVAAIVMTVAAGAKNLSRTEEKQMQE